MTAYQLAPTNPSDIFWTCQDVGLFFLVLSCLDAVLRLAVRFRFMSHHDLDQPTSGLLFFLLVFLSCLLFGILKIRYRRKVWHSLGWTLPSLRYIHLGILTGMLLGLAVSYPSHLPGQQISLKPTWALVLLTTTLGPFLEETFFRGCVLPLIARNAGAKLAIFATAVLFAMLHDPQSLREWLWILATGIAYGWIRISSGSTSASALMHAAYNVTLYGCFRF